MMMMTYEEEKRLWEAYYEGQRESFKAWAETEEGKECLKREAEHQKELMLYLKHIQM